MQVITYVLNDLLRVNKTSRVASNVLAVVLIVVVIVVAIVVL